MIVLIGAMREEVSPFLDLLEGANRLTIPHLYAVRGSLQGAAILVVWTGEGERRARTGVSALLRSLEDERVERVYVVGVAGGLAPELAAGDVVIGGSVQVPGDAAPRHLWKGQLWNRFPPRRDLRRDLSTQPGRLAHDVVVGTVLTADRIVVSRQEKERLWHDLNRPRAAAVDMESYYMVDGLAKAGLDWTVVRAVSDTAQESLPSWLNRCVASEGAISRSRVALGAALRPWSIGGLIRLRRQVTAAARRLVAVVVELGLGEQSQCPKP